MCGSCSPAASLISRLNRSVDISWVSSGASTFTTTSRPSCASRATNTRAIPPPPSSRAIVYAAPSDDWSCSRSASVTGARRRARSVEWESDSPADDDQTRGPPPECGRKARVTRRSLDAFGLRCGGRSNVLLDARERLHAAFAHPVLLGGDPQRLGVREGEVDRQAR